MARTEEYLALNKAKVIAIVDSYLKKYENEYPEKRDVDTASEFLNKHYEDFRHSVAALTTDTIHQLIQDRTIVLEETQKVMEANSWNIGRLFVAIMTASGVNNLASI